MVKINIKERQRKVIHNYCGFCILVIQIVVNFCVIVNNLETDKKYLIVWAF